MTTHQRVLERLNSRWIDFSSRQKLPKRKLPAHAYDRIPSCFVRALPTDRKPADVAAQFIGVMHNHPRFKRPVECIVQSPTMLAWHVFTPDGVQYFICYWREWKKHTAALFTEFCEKTGRTCGVLLPDQTIDFGSRRVSYFDCNLVHEDDVRPRQSTSGEITEAGRDVVATARKLLRARTATRKDLEVETFCSDVAAHDAELNERLCRKFVKKASAIQKKLTAEFGTPAETGDAEHRRIPVNGVFQYAIWKTKGKTLFLAAHHEDTELPYAVVLGTF